jgi:hypothetical protein
MAEEKRGKGEKGKRRKEEGGWSPLLLCTVSPLLARGGWVETFGSSGIR